MPVPLFKHHFCRRGETGPKAHAHAAYLSGTKLDDGFGNTADFTPKGGILHAEVWSPADAPSWAKDRGALWRSLEAREDKSTRHAKAILAHKFIGALPHELSLEENIRYVKDFVREQFTRKGYAADWAIHAPDPGSDNRNYHVHIMVPLRKLGEDGWAKTKDRFPKNSPALSQYIREKQQAFFDLQNRYLQKNGYTAQIVRKNGKWTVIEATKAISPQVSLSSSARHGEEWGLPSGVMPKPPPLALGLGGGSIEAQTSRQMLGRYAGLVEAQNLNRKGWPPKAIEDWELWGHKNPQRFFELWPECSSGNHFAANGKPQQTDF